MVPAHSCPPSSNRRFWLKIVSFIFLLALITGAFGGAPAHAQSVALLYFRVTPVNGQTLIEWETATELDTAGFWLQRSQQPGSGLHGYPTLSRRRGVLGASYSVTDTAVMECVIYYYALEVVGSSGASEDYRDCLCKCVP